MSFVVFLIKHDLTSNDHASYMVIFCVNEKSLVNDRAMTVHHNVGQTTWQPILICSVVYLGNTRLLAI